MKIKLTSIYVDDQDKALRFYTVHLEGRLLERAIPLAYRRITGRA